MTSDDEPDSLVPIGTVVAQLQRDYPDVTHSSLRFLEREGLIAPTRTPGGHRLFSRADVERVRQIKDWQAQRLSLTQIHERLRQQENIGSTGDLATRFLELALAGDLSASRTVVLDAADLGLPINTIFEEVLRPALVELGDRWASKEVSVAQEKEVSETARELVAELSIRFAAQVDDRLPSVVAACVSGEEHELGLRMLCGILRARGVNVHYLGADVDPQFLIEAVRLRDPDIVLLSATLDRHLQTLRDAIATVRQEGFRGRIIVGGQAARAHADRIRDWGVDLVQDGVLELIEAITLE